MRGAVLALFSIGGALLAQTPPKFFELEIPDLQNRIFDGDIVELPLSSIGSIAVHLLNPMADKVPYGKIYPKLNGDSTSVICQFRSDARGKVALMNLKLRSDMRLQPGSNTLEIAATDQRGRRYYKNWVLRTREQARNEWFTYESTVSPADEGGAPPEVMLTAPEYPVIFTDEKPKRVRIQGVVSAVHPLASVTINGARVEPAADTGQFSHDLMVAFKDTHVAVEAADQKGNRARVTVPVVQENRARPAKLTGERYALVIGISRYRNHPGAPPDGSSASADAQNFASMLVSKAGFQSDRVLVLRDDRATLAQVKSAFRNFVAQAKPDDMMLVYFAGNGVHDPAAPEKIYLATNDTTASQLDETALALTELEDLLSANVRSRAGLLLFDVGRDSGPDWRFAGANLVNHYLLRLASNDQHRAVLVSSAVNQISREESTSGAYQSLFAHWLSEALNGKADWNHDGLLTVGELFRYVADRIRLDTNGQQTPRFSLGGTDARPLAASSK